MPQLSAQLCAQPSAPSSRLPGSEMGLWAEG